MDKMEPTGEKYTVYRLAYMTDEQWQYLEDAIADIVACVEEEWEMD